MTKKINILYVEDSVSDVQLLTLSLERFCPNSQAELVVAASLKEAKQQFEQGQFSLVLIDYNLPDGTGGEFVEYIRQSGSRLPLYLLSGLVTDEHLSFTEKYVNVKCVEKNYTPEFLAEITARAAIQSE